MTRKAGNPNWQKGKSGNPNGRPTGSKNRTTEEIRTFFQQILSANLENLEGDLIRMNPYQRWATLIAVGKKVLPDLNNNTNNDTISGGIDIVVKYADENDNEISPN
jgi:hypothetical protein